MLLLEVVGKADKVAPLQMGFMASKVGIVGITFLNTEMSLEFLFADTKSGMPSPSKSPMATEIR